MSLNGDYIKDKKYIEKCFEDNKKDHDEIKAKLSDIDKKMEEMIVVKTKVNGLIYAVIIMIPPLLITLLNLIMGWILR